MKNLKLDLIIERGSDGELAGRVTYNDNLIIDQAGSVRELEDKLRQLLYDFEDVNPEAVDFTHLYDVYALFDDFDFLKITNIARHADINPGLLRQYGVCKINCVKAGHGSQFKSNFILSPNQMASC